MDPLKWTYVKHAISLMSSNLDHVLEFGVSWGGSMTIIKTELNKKEAKYEVFGFDSFIGLPKEWRTINGHLLAKAGHFSTNEKTPDIPNVTWFSGWFKDTIPEYLKIAKNIALLHLDCDLYESAKDVFYGLQNFIVKGTIIAMDDWFEKDDPRSSEGMQDAFHEWMSDFNRDVKFHENPGTGISANIQRIVEVLK